MVLSGQLNYKTLSSWGVVPCRGVVGISLCRIVLTNDNRSCRGLLVNSVSLSGTSSRRRDRPCSVHYGTTLSPWNYEKEKSAPLGDLCDDVDRVDVVGVVGPNPHTHRSVSLTTLNFQRGGDGKDDLPVDHFGPKRVARDVE